MKKAIILFLALSSAIAYVTDMQAQTTERQDAVGKFRIVPLQICRRRQQSDRMQ